MAVYLSKDQFLPNTVHTKYHVYISEHLYIYLINYEHTYAVWNNLVYNLYSITHNMRGQYILFSQSFWLNNNYKYLFFVSSFRFNPVNSVSMAGNKNIISTVNHNFVYNIQIHLI